MTKRLKSIVTAQAKRLHPDLPPDLVSRAVEIVEAYQFDKDIVVATGLLRKAVEEAVAARLDAEGESRV